MGRKKVVYTVMAGTLLVASYKVVYSMGMTIGRILTVKEMVSNFDKVSPGFKKNFIKNIIDEKIDKIFDEKEQ